MPSLRSRLLIGLALVLYCLIYQVNQSQPFFYSRLCTSCRDAVIRSGRFTAPNPDLVFLAIDADSVTLDATTDTVEMYGLTDRNSIEARAFSLMTQRYPWPREIYGLVLKRLVDAGAKVVLFDLTFPTETDGDKPFREMLDRYKDHVVIGSNFVNPSWNGPARVGAALTRPPETLVPPTSPMDDRVAFTNYWPDADDVVRQAQYRVTFEQVEGQQPNVSSERFLSLAGEACVKMGMANAVPEDLDPHTIRFTGLPRQAFPPHSLFEIFVPDYWQHNYRNGDFFRGKTVVVGAEGNWQHDEHQTPFGSMPGPELHLNAINAAVHGEFIGEMPLATVQLLSAVTAILAVAISIWIGSPWIRFLALIVFDAAGAIGVLYIFDHASFYVPSIAPLTQFNATVLLGMLVDFTHERVENKRVRRTLERYVSRDLVGQMLDHKDSFEHSLGGILKPATILFSDIRGFTAVTRRTEPHLLVRQLNEYFSAMVDCVFRFEGTLDKFIGDAVMAVWGSIHTQGESADARHAVQAAQAMQQELHRLNILWAQRGWPTLKAGIAIHHGSVIVGNVGSAQRMEFTVIGEAVNLTWKLQEHTKRQSAHFIFSQAVAQLLGDGFETVSLGLAEIAGLEQAVEVFTLAGEMAHSSPAEFCDARVT